MKTITESFIQQECLIHLNNTYGMKKHSPRLLMFSIPNEIAMMIRSALLELGLPASKVDQAVAIALKKVKNTGFTPGVSDSIIVMPGKTLYVEFKTMIGIQSNDQKEFESRVTALGHKYHLCRSLTEFKKIISDELNN